jgi:hypothetical protein
MRPRLLRESATATTSDEAHSRLDRIICREPTGPPAGRLSVSPGSPGPVAQRLEQWTHNPLVAGSNPAGPTKNAWNGHFTPHSASNLGQVRVMLPHRGYPCRPFVGHAFRLFEKSILATTSAASSCIPGMT